MPVNRKKEEKVTVGKISEKELEKLREQVGYKFDPTLMKDIAGRYWTQGLFKEMSYGKDRPVVLSFKNEDDGDIPSFKRIFVELGDPTGYIPAMVLLGSWDHWLKLCDQSWFKRELARAVDELNIQLKSKALSEITSISKSEGSTALQAARYLLEGKWDNELPKKAGRPKKGTSAKDKEFKSQVVSIEHKETEYDYERLGLGEG